MKFLKITVAFLTILLAVNILLLQHQKGLVLKEKQGQTAVEERHTAKSEIVTNSMNSLREITGMRLVFLLVMLAAAVACMGYTRFYLVLSLLFLVYCYVFPLGKRG